MTKFEWYVSGKLFGIKYTLLEGDNIKRHAHEAETLHNIIVMKGAIKFEIDETEYVYEAGKVVDFDGALPHKITGIDRQTVILNMFLNGIPAGYDQLPESEWTGYLQNG